MPVIAVRDIAVQERENDLVLGTFGRGFYVLDDYAPLRGLTKETLEREATLFPARDALLYVPARPLELRGKSFMGETFFTAPNPPFGAVLTYHLKDKVRSRKEARQEREKEAAKKGETVPYPTLDELRAEAEEDAPAVYLTVTDAAGNVVRRVAGDLGKGFHRVAWDLRFPPATPTEAKPWDPEADDNLFSEPPMGPLVKPGPYRATLARRVARRRDRARRAGRRVGGGARRTPPSPRRTARRWSPSSARPRRCSAPRQAPCAPRRRPTSAST